MLNEKREDWWWNLEKSNMQEADRGGGRLPIALPVLSYAYTENTAAGTSSENCPGHFSVHFVSLWLYFQFSNVWILVQHPSFSSKTGAQKHRETKTKRILKGNVRGSSKQQNSEQLKCKCQQTNVRKVARFMKFGCLKISSWIQFLIRTPWDTARDSHLLVFIPEVSTTPIT